SEVCDRVMVMYAGKVVETGSTMDVINSPLHPYTRRLIDCVPRLGHPDKTLQAIPGMAPAINDLPEGCAFAERCDFAAEICRDHDMPLDEIDSGRAVRCIRIMKGEI
ncbi:MAG: peptide ABC transporter permease, partial [bacterium]|nr:peptide ABC transporter permease [bacterium]